MTTNGLAPMSRDLEPCRQKEVVLLTAPVGLRGTYCNFYWDAFDATTDCPPASFLTVCASSVTTRKWRSGIAATACWSSVCRDYARSDGRLT